MLLFPLKGFRLRSIYFLCCRPIPYIYNNRIHLTTLMYTRRGSGRRGDCISLNVYAATKNV